MREREGGGGMERGERERGGGMERGERERERENQQHTTNTVSTGNY